MTIKNKQTLISPLRYPGAKKWISSFISNAIQFNKLSIDCFIEPFAGGANVSLSLLSQKMVKKIGLVELDPLVASFWHTVFYNTQWLIDQVERVQVNVAMWEEIKQWNPLSTREKGFKCLFLNRTNFSGILKPNTGPIGGKTQKSRYKINCRFNKATIIRRIKAIGEFRDRVAFIWNLDWKTALNGVLHFQKKGGIPMSTFFYLDPPFFKKGKTVYKYFFCDWQHLELRNYLLRLNQPWVLSYDLCPEILTLYKNVGYHANNIDLKYTTSAIGKNDFGREIVISNKSNCRVGMKLGADKYISESQRLDSKYPICSKNRMGDCYGSSITDNCFNPIYP